MGYRPVLIVAPRLLHRIEKPCGTPPAGVLVACMGHYSALPRASSIRLLNVLYDGVDWQLAGAHETAIRFEHDPFVVEVFTPAAAVPDASRLRILVCGPPYERAASSRVDHILTMHVPDECTVADAWLPVPVIEPSTGAGGGRSESDGGGGATPPPPRFERTSVLRVMATLAPFSRCGEGKQGRPARLAVPIPQSLSRLRRFLRLACRLRVRRRGSPPCPPDLSSLRSRAFFACSRRCAPCCSVCDPRNRRSGQCCNDLRPCCRRRRRLARRARICDRRLARSRPGALHRPPRGSPRGAHARSDCGPRRHAVHGRRRARQARLLPRRRGVRRRAQGSVQRRGA